ncbi:Modification methylase PaeR7I [Planctomycetes bacterium Pan216]|uniref:site-specific DNA-methyltransferase (adenine-specific) n=1 Tax=Kolteria novifilia TaxID=2527975 RepID=A0A518B9U0_9BACT|nr:Modification methylase PaeR7I [Planctomycetes bacterium Pan216]
MSSAATIKRLGIHYTPTALAEFLAERGWAYVDSVRDRTRVLDPACGDGELLLACHRVAPTPRAGQIELTGIDLEDETLAVAQARLCEARIARPTLRRGDFVEESLEPSYDLVIANPPYVRTQQLGAARTRELAKRFGLSGRIDLAHVFVKRMTEVVRPGGVIALLTSNRFLFTRAGRCVREMLSGEFRVREVWDLGDAKLFKAAVLPAVVVIVREPSGGGSRTPFVRIYEDAGAEGPPPSPPWTRGSEKEAPWTRGSEKEAPWTRGSEKEEGLAEANGLLDLLRAGWSGSVATSEGRYRIERGELAFPTDPSLPWYLLNEENAAWLDQIDRAKVATFGDVGKIRVGIKTTADVVFVRNDWASLPDDGRPEDELLRPLLTHREAERWCCAGEVVCRVLYPHEIHQGRRRPVALQRYPGAEAYLKEHEAILRKRSYVTKANRRWYEIWVPQDPDGWSEPKIVAPDIATEPRFGLDESGAVVNGDCYWITLREGREADWLLLMLGIANSSLMTQYYDARFHNKLYSGRRRFMTQYVSACPLPDLGSAPARALVRLVKRLLEGRSDARAESRVNELAWRCFGLTEPGGRPGGRQT